MNNFVADRTKAADGTRLAVSENPPLAKDIDHLRHLNRPSSGISNVYASPVGAANRVYITDREGTTLVIRHGEIPRILALNRLDDSFSASAAVVGRELYLRGRRNLYCISEARAE